MGNGIKFLWKVLIIDDNEVNTIVLANMLKMFQIDADQVSSGMDALELLEWKDYDMIFVDHIMPRMDGVQTTRAIRGMDHYRDCVILALTSSLTEEVKREYQSAGADDVYVKPLGLTELSKIIQRWCPRLIPEVSLSNTDTIEQGEEDTLLRTFLDGMEKIDYETGIKYALGNPRHYIEILKVSLKDIQTCMKLAEEGSRHSRMEEIRIGIHNVKNVFVNIGAISLSELAKELESRLLQENWELIESTYLHFALRVGDFYDRLDAGLKNYLLKVREKETENRASIIPMIKEEYEQSIRNTIYYIRRYDYVAILKELEGLIKQRHPQYQAELELAMEEIKEYRYEAILRRMTTLLNLINRAGASDFSI